MYENRKVVVLKSRCATEELDVAGGEVCVEA